MVTQSSGMRHLIALRMGVKWRPSNSLDICLLYVACREGIIWILIHTAWSPNAAAEK